MIKSNSKGFKNDKDISEKNYDLALEKLNSLIKEEYKPSETFLKRGRLCHKLLMLDDAYSDFTYIITHCVKKEEAYYERVALNYEMSNYYEAIMDCLLYTSPSPRDS